MIKSLNNAIFKRLVQTQCHRNLCFDNKGEYFEVVECAPRDGLQNLREFVPTEIKVELINRLTNECGVKSLEGTSYSHPKWIPQLADNSQVLSQIQKKNDVKYRLFIPSLKGLQDAIDNGHAHDIVSVTAPTESLCKVNMNCTFEDSLNRIKKMAELATKNHVRHTGGIACALGCAYEGKVSPTKVAKMAERLLEFGCDIIGIADTIGVGNASSVNALFDELLKVVPAEKITVHFHDTYGQALANVLVSMERGVRTAESCVAGLGGGPYAKGAAGNLATENLVYMLHDMGFSTGIDLDKMVETGMWMCEKVKQPNASETANAMWKIKNDQSKKGELPTTPFLK